MSCCGPWLLALLVSAAPAAECVIGGQGQGDGAVPSPVAAGSPCDKVGTDGNRIGPEGRFSLVDTRIYLGCVDWGAVVGKEQRKRVVIIVDRGRATRYGAILGRKHKSETLSMRRKQQIRPQWKDVLPRAAVGHVEFSERL